MEPQDHLPSDRPVIAYMSPGVDPKPSTGAEFAIGFTAFAVTAGMVLFLGLIFALNHPGQAMPRREQEMIVIVCGLAVVGSIIGLAIAFGAQTRRAFVIGALLGLGVACLIEGLCFVNA